VVKQCSRLKELVRFKNNLIGSGWHLRNLDTKTLHIAKIACASWRKRGWHLKWSTWYPNNIA